MYFVSGLLLPLLLAAGIGGEHCLEPADALGREIPFTSDASPSLPKNSQVIVTTYRFTCEGMIFAWSTYVQENDGSTLDELQHRIHFQVWRPSSAVESDGCYNLVGENVFDDVLAAEDGLISVTVSPEDAIIVSPGDVVGYFAHSDFSEVDASANNNTEIKLDTSYTNETIWYHVNTAEDPLIINGGSSCSVQVGDGGTLRSNIHAAPVLSIEMVPATAISPSPTTTAQTHFVIPTASPGGVQPKSRGLSNLYIILFVVLGCLIFLVLLSTCLVILVAVAIKRRREKKRLKSHVYSEVSRSTDPLYEAIGPAPEIEVTDVDVHVAPNESYGLVESAASGVTYDSVNVTIKQSFKNLAITLP